MSKSVMIIDTPRDCCECPFGTIVFGKGVCLLDEGNGIECPLKPYKDFVPIEWIVKWLEAEERILRISPPYYNQVRVPKMLEDWEKENETNRH